jgi:hypothetical protein
MIYYYDSSSTRHFRNWRMHFNFDDYFFRAIPHRTTALYHFDQMPIDPIKIVCLQQEKWISGGKTFDIVCLFCRSYELICAWKGWLYVSLWKLLFLFLYHWHFGGLWTTFLQIIMSKFNAMNFHHLFYKTSYLPSYDSTLMLMLYLLPSFWCMKHYPNFNTGAHRQDPHMVPHVVVPPTNLFSFIFLFLIYFAWKIYGNTDKQVFWHVRVDW